MVLGLLVSAAVLFRVGLTDTLGALTFGGRVMGVVFLAGALVETVAAAAALDHWGKRATRYAGQSLLLGVVVVTVTSLMFLILQWEGVITPVCSGSGSCWSRGPPGRCGS